MSKQQIIGARLVAAFGLLLSLGVGSLQAQPGGFGGGNQAALNAEAAKAPTPRLPNGKPDLTGSWQAAGGGQRNAPGGMFRRCSPFQVKSCMEWTNQSIDFAWQAPMRLDPNQPLYKPEYWDQVIEHDQWTNRDDPVMTCLPLGNPRAGAPSRIYHTNDDILMMYRGGVDGGGGYPDFRMIRLDGQPHDPQRALQYTYMGYTVGRWEGDTLVLDSIGFTDETWLGRGGKIHSDQMHIIEKFTRTGNLMTYDVTVEETEGLIDLVRRTKEAEVSAVLKETDEGVRVSLRSVTEVDVSIVAAGFGGGGHRYAAGFTSSASLASVQEALREAVAVAVKALHHDES